MNEVFSRAAIERIARVVQIPARDGEVLSAADFVRRAREENLANKMLELDLESLISFYWLNDDRKPALRLVSFAGLLELGIQGGYLSLDGWEGAPALNDVLSAFVGEASEGGPLDLGLLEALLRRLSQAEPGPQIRDNATLASFESYLHLTSRVRADDGVLAFLEETHTSGTPSGRNDKDRPALLSPAHFAEAFATGAVAGVKVSDVAAGVGALRYLEWLGEILEALDPESPLRDGIVRHARWAQGAARVQGRFGLWADLMSEWTERPAEARAHWSTTAERLFGHLVAEQARQRQAAAGEPPVGEEKEELAVEINVQAPAMERVEQLVAEGRLTAARELVLEEAAQHLQSLHPAMPDWIERVEALVEHGRLLVDLGNADTAAALIAQVLPTLTEKYGRSGYKVVADALEIVKRAREAGPQGKMEEEAPEPPVRSIKPVAPEPEENRYQAFGESP